MRVMPASSAAWIVRIACASSGRPETESGMAPRPIGNTSTPPSRRVAVLVVALIGVAYPVGPPAGRTRRAGRRHAGQLRESVSFSCTLPEGVEPFQLVFVQRGVLEVAALSVAAGLVGTWLVLRGLAFYAHAVGSAAFPGLVLADGLGFGALLGAGGTAALVALGVGLLARREGARDRYDSLTALVLVAALALGVILASDVFHSAGSVERLLFGSLLLVDAGDY